VDHWVTAGLSEGDTRRVLEAALDATSGGVLVVDRQGRITFVNVQFAEMWRVPEDILASRDDHRLFAFVQGQLTDPEAFLERVRALRRAPAEEGRDELLLRDGRVFERHARAQRLDDRVIGRVLCFRDVTHARALEADLRASEQRCRHLYEYTPVMLHSIDAAGRLVSVSQCWLDKLGYTREEVIGRPSVAFLTEASRAYAERVVLPEYWRVGACADVPYDFLRKDGVVLHGLLSAIVDRDAGGSPVRSLAVVEDVTERRHAEAELARYRAHLEVLVEERTAELASANQELEAFNAMVSHDLRAPVRAVGGFADVLLTHYGDQLEPGARALAVRIRTAAARQAALIEDILALSRVGRVTMTRAEVDLSALAWEIAADVLAEGAGRRVEGAGRRADWVVEPGIVATGDPALLRILLENLLRNAWKFTARTVGARIELRTETVDGRVRYEVRDNGVGFDPAEASRLFRPFERLHPEFEGTGLGLVTVQRIVARHGGEVWATGAPGTGATFTFTLAARA
jgi:hypothetical protein